MAYPDPGNGQAAGPNAADGDQASRGADSIADRVARARLQPEPDEVPSLETPWASVLADESERPMSRVAALSRIAQTTVRLGRATECIAVLDQLRAAAGDDPAALVWALTASTACRSMFGQLGQARADLAEARKACYYATPLLAEPFWRFAEIMCGWLGGDWAAALAGAAVLDASQVSVLPSALAGTVAALHIELLRGLGVPGETQQLASRVAAQGPAEMSAWAQAGLDVDDGRPDDALRRLADVCDVGTRSVYRTALPLVLHRMAEIAFSCDERRVTSFAADALAELDRAAPVNEILAGLSQAYATRDPAPARRAQQMAEAEGAGALVAEALTVRGRIGDDPAETLAAAHAAWKRLGAAARAKAVAQAMRCAGLPAPRSVFEPADLAPAEGPAPLTARERSVARLVHEGRSNQQIARMLDISVKTVEAYLTRLYRKTSCSSRVELAVAVTERRLYLAPSDEKDEEDENEEKDG
jgi:DNA-binding NarL/FixJ family response regulator